MIIVVNILTGFFEATESFLTVALDRGLDFTERLFPEALAIESFFVLLIVYPLFLKSNNIYILVYYM